MKNFISRKITVSGMVQGIGYRPFVAELANKLHISGTVQNAAGVVQITATGNTGDMNAFTEDLEKKAPYGAFIFKIISEDIPVLDQNGFFIIKSEKKSEKDFGAPFLPVDLPVCTKCKRQLKNEKNRRYDYPFISCTACGPRYSIIESLPYDRENTVMQDFTMCRACTEEYTRVKDMRRHAQTISCHTCGPYLRLYLPDEDKEKWQRKEAFFYAVSILKKGGILAVKDIGGYHLVCDPFSESAVLFLRKLKEREKKPLAVMFSSVSEIKQYAQVSRKEIKLLQDTARPIVLLKKKKSSLSEKLFMNSTEVGAFLPTAPLQVMLLEKMGPLVMTSANVSGSPMLISDEKMKEWMKERLLALRKTENVVPPTGVLFHDRRILLPLDDSVVRAVDNHTQVIRRARGMVPNPIALPFSLSEDIFAAGADMKACFSYGNHDRAYFSTFFGDMDEKKVADTYQSEKERMKKLFSFSVQASVCDAHPLYKTKEALDFEKKECLLPVYHHQAHIASVMCEHHLTGRVLGIAYDGTGYGEDHTVWGSEFLLCRNQQAKRVGHLSTVTLIGADEGAKNTDTMCLCYLLEAEEYFQNRHEDVRMIQTYLSKEKEKTAILKAARKNHINSIASTSMGRLFDAVSALLDICHYNGYEGEAPAELEYMAEKAEKPYRMSLPIIKEKNQLAGCVPVLFSEILVALGKKVPREEIALGFLEALAQYTVEMTERIIGEEGLDGNVPIALSGGTFQNRWLLKRLFCLFAEHKKKVYINEQVPPNDGGIALGQLYLANEILKERKKKGTEPCV